MIRHQKAAAAALLTLALAGCSASPGLLTGEHHDTSHLAVDEAAASAWVTSYRRQHGLAAVTRDATLDAVAQRQADAMAAANQLSHSVAGPLPVRLALVGRGGGASAENVSAGYKDLSAALAGWQRSPEHNRNLLFAPMRRIGVAGAAAPGTRYKTFWALVMTD